jgi:hypothetical protein
VIRALLEKREISNLGAEGLHQLSNCPECGTVNGLSFKSTDKAYISCWHSSRVFIRGFDVRGRLQQYP